REETLRLSQPCSAILAADGTLVLAVDGDGHRDERIIKSKDRGATWTVGKGDMKAACDKKYVIHPALYQRRDGSLFAFLRGQFPMPGVVSTDMGESWQMVETPFPGISVGQKPTVLRLQSGALVFASADSKRASIGGNFVALSFDDGKTWPHIHKLNNMFGYMYLAQAPNGTIYLTGGRGSAINVMAFNEAWLKTGNQKLEGKPETRN
ncbi:MAG: sialidase family protein, partial [Gemmataceae bacterium]